MCNIVKLYITIYYIINKTRHFLEITIAIVLEERAALSCIDRIKT